MSVAIENLVGITSLNVNSTNVVLDQKSPVFLKKENENDSTDNTVKEVLEEKKSTLTLLRDIADFDNNVSSSSSSCDDSLHEADLPTGREFYQKSQREQIIRYPGEVLPEELPPIDRLTVDDAELGNQVPEELGQVTGIVNTLVIVRSLDKSIPLLDTSVLFLDGKKILGEVFETFGPVSRPYYSVRFNNTEDIKESVCIGDTVYVLPNMKQYTKYVFNIHELQRNKGSDASWKDDVECPEDFVECSDDDRDMEPSQNSFDHNKKQQGGNARKKPVRKAKRKVSENGALIRSSHFTACGSTNNVSSCGPSSNNSLATGPVCANGIQNTRDTPFCSFPPGGYSGGFQPYGMPSPSFGCAPNFASPFPRHSFFFNPFSLQSPNSSPPCPQYQASSFVSRYPIPGISMPPSPYIPYNSTSFVGNNFPPDVPFRPQSGM